MTDLLFTMETHARLIALSFLSISALSCRVYYTTFGDFPLLILAYTELNRPVSNSSPAWSTLRSHSSSRSFAPSLAPTSVDFKKSSSGPTASSFASNSASPFFSVHPCQRIPSLYNFLRSFRRSFLHFLHLVYKCSTDCTACPHHQH